MTRRSSPRSSPAPQKAHEHSHLFELSQGNSLLLLGGLLLLRLGRGLLLLGLRGGLFLLGSGVRFSLQGRLELGALIIAEAREGGLQIVHRGGLGGGSDPRRGTGAHPAG